MFYRRPDKHVSAYDDDWEDIPASGPLPKWFGGVIVPLALVSYGISCLVTGHGQLSGHGVSMDLEGPRATALAIAGISAGLFLHCHYFWGNIYQLSAFAVVGKILALGAFIASLGYLIVQVGIFG